MLRDENSQEQQDMLLDNKKEILTIQKGMKSASVFFFALLILEIPLSILVYQVQKRCSEQYTSLISILMTQGYLLLAAIIYIARTKTSLVKELRIKKYKPSSFFLSLLVLITASPMATFLNVFSQLFAKNEMSTAIFQITELVPMWLGILIIGCLPGLVEETLYRGIMMAAFRKRSIITGVIVSALSFGLMHMNFNQILYAMYLGMVFACIVEATGSLVSTMILHMLFNGINTAYVYILPHIYQFLGQYSDQYVQLDMENVLQKQPSTVQIVSLMMVIAPFAIGGILLSWLLIRAIASINGRTITFSTLRGERETSKNIKPINGYLIAGWVFCLLMSVSNLFS